MVAQTYRIGVHDRCVSKSSLTSYKSIDGGRFILQIAENVQLSAVGTHYTKQRTPEVKCQKHGSRLNHYHY